MTLIRKEVTPIIDRDKIKIGDIVKVKAKNEREFDIGIVRFINNEGIQLMLMDNPSMLIFANEISEGIYEVKKQLLTDWEDD